MSLTLHCQLNLQARPFVPTIMAPKLAHRRGKGEGGEEPASKHQIRSGNERWTGRHGVGRLNPRREAKIQGANLEVSERKLISTTVCFLPTRANKERRTGKIRGAFSGVHRALGGWMLARAPASPAQGLHQHGPWYFNFLISV